MNKLKYFYRSMNLSIRMKSVPSQIAAAFLPMLISLKLTAFTDMARQLADGYIDKRKRVIGKHVWYNSIADVFRNGVYFVVMWVTVWEVFHDPAKGLGTFMLVLSSAAVFTSRRKDVSVSTERLSAAT